MRSMLRLQVLLSLLALVSLSGPTPAVSTTAIPNENQGPSASPSIVSFSEADAGGVVSGELKQWHCVTVRFDGPSTSETNVTNPFLDYRLNVIFSHTNSGKSYLVPGFYAADGNAADTSADSGNQWQVRFSPDEMGTWSYSASFRTGTAVAISDDPGAGSAVSFDGASGSFEIAASDKTGRDFRGKGRLQYVGQHHLRFAGTGEYFLKAGADAPENYLAYDDIDDTPNCSNLRKSWAPHALYYDPADASAYTWAGGKGSNILGAVKYLSDQGMNAQSFLTFSLDGDDDNVFPHRLSGTVADYESIADDQRWGNDAVYKERFDVSKMEQWNRIFSYLQKKGMYLHFKMQETENDQRMDNGNVGTERKIYYRELIARYSCHLALNWNLGEENSQTDQQRKDMAQYFRDHDPYQNNIVVHTGPQEKNAIYTPLLGTNSSLTGASLQSAAYAVFADTKSWVSQSAIAGHPWVVANDEQGPENIGIQCDSFDANHDSDRREVLWGNLMGGGAGIESYFGYATCGTSGGGGASDLTCQELGTRANWWNQCRLALEFFATNSVPFWEMSNEDQLLSGVGDAHCLAKAGSVYVVYLPTSGQAHLNLSAASGDYTVRWFDPFLGGSLQQGSVLQVNGGGSVNLGVPPASGSNDRIALVRRIIPEQYLGITQDGSNLVLSWTNAEFRLQYTSDLWTNFVTIPASNSPYTNLAGDSIRYYRLIHMP